MESIEHIKKNIIQMVDEIVMNKQILVNFLSKNDIVYSVNKNGIFINISLLSDEVIIRFYKLLQNNINNLINSEKYEEECEIYLNKINKTKIETKDIPINTSEIKQQSLKLNDLQIKILDLI